jgi:hypothetical protein
MLALSVALLAQAQQAPEDVSELQIVQYKARLQAGCVKDANQGGLVAIQAQAFCGCTAKQLEEAMSLPEWQVATYQSSRQAEKEEMTVLLPHIRKAARACAATLK